MFRFGSVTDSVSVPFWFGYGFRSDLVRFRIRFRFGLVPGFFPVLVGFGHGSYFVPYWFGFGSGFVPLQKG